jgi:hypothetical protein
VLVVHVSTVLADQFPPDVVLPPEALVEAHRMTAEAAGLFNFAAKFAIKIKMLKA